MIFSLAQKKIQHMRAEFHENLKISLICFMVMDVIEITADIFGSSIDFDLLINSIIPKHLFEQKKYLFLSKFQDFTVNFDFY